MKTVIWVNGDKCRVLAYDVNFVYLGNKCIPAGATAEQAITAWTKRNTRDGYVCISLR